MTNYRIILIGLIILGSLMSTIGFRLLFFSGNLGLSHAENWLAEQGGADTSTSQLVMVGYTNSFLATGSILFGISAYYKNLLLISKE